MFRLSHLADLVADENLDEDGLQALGSLCDVVKSWKDWRDGWLFPEVPGPRVGWGRHLRRTCLRICEARPGCFSTTYQNKNCKGSTVEHVCFQDGLGELAHFVARSMLLPWFAHFPGDGSCDPERMARVAGGPIGVDPKCHRMLWSK